MTASRTSAKPARRLTMETLEARDCPAVVLSPISMAGTPTMSARITRNADTPTAVVVGQKITILDDGAARAGLSFLETTTYRHRVTGQTWQRSTRIDRAGVRIENLDVFSGLDAARGGVTYRQTNALASTAERNVTFHGDYAAPGKFAAQNNAFRAELKGVASGGRMTLRADGRAGNDTITATVAGKVAAGAYLDVSLHGGAGADRVTIDADADVEAGAALRLVVSGDAAGSFNGTADGADVVGIDYAGKLDGAMMFDLSGGGKSDRLDLDLAFAAMSSGRIAPDGWNYSSMAGGAGKDALSFDLVADPTSDVRFGAPVFIDGVTERFYRGIIYIGTEPAEPAAPDTLCRNDAAEKVSEVDVQNSLSSQVTLPDGRVVWRTLLVALPDGEAGYAYVQHWKGHTFAPLESHVQRP